MSDIVEVKRWKKSNNNFNIYISTQKNHKESLLGLVLGFGLNTSGRGLCCLCSGCFESFRVSSPWLRLHHGGDDAARHRCEGHELIEVHPAVLHAVRLRPCGQKHFTVVSSYCRRHMSTPAVENDGKCL